MNPLVRDNEYNALCCRSGIPSSCINLCHSSQLVLGIEHLPQLETQPQNTKGMLYTRNTVEAIIDRQLLTTSLLVNSTGSCSQLKLQGGVPQVITLPQPLTVSGEPPNTLEDIVV